jgi:hypothetical protein
MNFAPEVRMSQGQTAQERKQQMNWPLSGSATRPAYPRALTWPRGLGSRGNMVRSRKPNSPDNVDVLGETAAEIHTERDRVCKHICRDGTEALGDGEERDTRPGSGSPVVVENVLAQRPDVPDGGAVQFRCRCSRHHAEEEHEDLADEHGEELGKKRRRGSVRITTDVGLVDQHRGDRPEDGVETREECPGELGPGFRALLDEPEVEGTTSEGDHTPDEREGGNGQAEYTCSISGSSSAGLARFVISLT